jgi:hypothetical protein
MIPKKDKNFTKAPTKIIKPKVKLNFDTTVIEKEIDIDLVIFDRENYQRNIDYQRAEEIAEDYIACLQNPPIVNKRKDGYYYVIDGQHRVVMNRMLGFKTIVVKQFVKCLTILQETLLFNIANKNQRHDTKTHLFQNERKVESPDFLEIDRIVNHYGFQMNWSNSKKNNTIYALVKTKELYDQNILEDTLSFIKDCWTSSPDLASINMIEVTRQLFLIGISNFVKKYQNEIKQKKIRERFIKVLSKKGALGIAQEANKLKNTIGRASNISSSKYIAIAILDEYNKGLKGNKLPDRIFEA